MNITAGIDVAKHELVVYVNNCYFSISNDRLSLEKWFKKHEKTLENVDCEPACR